jgi:hypothetical protein
MEIRFTMTFKNTFRNVLLLYISKTATVMSTSAFQDSR